MNWLSITIIVLFSIGLFSIILLYFLRRKQVSLANKSIFNEIKKAPAFTFVSILFFTLLFSTIIGGFSANDKFLDVANSTINETATPFELSFANDLATFDYDDSAGENDPGTINGYDAVSLNESKARQGQYDDGKSTKKRSLQYEAAWCQSLVRDNVDIFAPRPGGGFYSPIEVVDNYYTYSNSPFIYQIGDINSDFDLSYLYCLDYEYAKITQQSNPDKAKNAKNYNFSYSFTALINLQVKVPGTNERLNVQVNMLPDSNIFNTFESENGTKNISSFYSDSEGATNSLEDDEAFIIYNKENSDFVKNANELELIYPNNNFRVDNYIFNNSIDTNRSYKLSIKDKGSHSTYLTPYDFTTTAVTLETSIDSEKNDNNIYLFVNENTMNNLFMTFLTKELNNLDTFIGDIFNIQSIKDGGNENKFGREQNFVDFKFYLMNENIYSSTNYYKKGMLKNTKDRSFLFNNWNIFSNQDYFYDNGKYIELEPDDKFNLSLYYNDQTNTPIETVYFNFSNFVYYGNESTSYITEPDYRNNGSIIWVLDTYNNYSSTLYIYLFAFLLLGFIVSLSIINKTFKNNIKQIGILKSIGYSQTSISLSISNKVLITLIISLVTTILFVPLIIFFWQNILAAQSLINLGTFTISSNAFVYGILLIFGSFWIFSFVILRIFYLPKPALYLTKGGAHKITNQILDTRAYTNSNMPFQAKLSINENTRNFSKSLVLFISSISIMFFTTLAMSTQKVLFNTKDSIVSYFPKDLLYLYNTNNFYTTMSEEEFNNKVNNNQINKYLLSEDKTYKTVDWNSMDEIQYISNFENFFVDYYLNTEVDVNNLKYIANEEMYYIINIIEIGKNKGAFDDNSTSDIVNKDAFNFYSFINDVDYPYKIKKDSNGNNIIDNNGFNSLEFKYNKGVTIGFEVYNKNNSIPIIWTANSDLYPKDNSLDRTSTGINTPILFIDIDYLDSITELFYSTNVLPVNEVSPSDDDIFESETDIKNFISDWKSKINSEPDGVVPFYFSQDSKSGSFVYESGRETMIGTNYQLNLNRNFFTDSNKDGHLVDNSDPNNLGKVPYDVDFEYQGVIGMAVSFFGAVIPINDPDLQLNTQIDSNGNFSFDEDEPSFIKYNRSNFGFSGLVDSQILNIELSSGVRVELASSGISNDYYSVSFSKNDLYTKDVKGAFYNDKSTLSDLTVSEYLSSGTQQYMNNIVSPYAFTGSFNSYQDMAETFSKLASNLLREPLLNAIENSSLSKPIKEFIRNFIDTVLPSYNYNDYGESTWTDQEKINEMNEAIEKQISFFKGKLEQTNLQLNNQVFESGVGILASETFVSIAEPEIETIQDSISIYSIFAILITVSLVLIIIIDMINNNRKNNLLLKTIGYSNWKLTLNSFFSYILVYAVAIAVSIPLIIGFNNFVISITPLIIGIYPLNMITTSSQYLIAFGVLMFTLIIAVVISYLYNQKIKPIKISKQN